jgi:hypothetical protein
VALAAIYKSAEQIGTPYQASLNGALRDLESYFGFQAVVKAPVGGARTKAQCTALGTSWTVSDHYEDRPARAVDIDNHRRFRNINAAAFEWILAMHGWHNITISGEPFPEEPWHFANHDSHPQQAGGGVVPIPNTPPLAQLRPKEDDVTDFIYYAETASTDGTIVAGQMFYQECIGAPLFPFTAGKKYTETAALMEYSAFLDQKDPYGSFSAYTAARYPTSGDNIKKLIALRGLATKPTGNFAGAVEVGDITVDNAAVVAALQENTAVQREVLAAILALNPPG